MNLKWNINGVEKGNMIIESGFTLTVGGMEGGQMIVFNSRLNLGDSRVIRFKVFKPTRSALLGKLRLECVNIDFYLLFESLLRRFIEKCH